jgi:hypothetical protein
MRRILAVLAASAAVSVAGPAGALTFDFSFINVDYGGDLVEGSVSNLLDNATNDNGEVAFSSNPAGFGVGSYPVGGSNVFTVANGTIVDAFYLSFGDFNTNPATACCTLLLDTGDDGGVGLSNSPGSVSLSSAASLTFTPAPIPLPAPFGLLAAGLGLLAWVGRARRSRLGQAGDPAPDRGRRGAANAP